MQQPSRKLRKILLGFDQHLYQNGIQDNISAGILRTADFELKFDYKLFF